MEVKNRVQIVVTGITGFITLESAYQRNVRQSSAPEIEGCCNTDTVFWRATLHRYLYAVALPASLTSFSPIYLNFLLNSDRLILDLNCFLTSTIAIRNKTKRVEISKNSTVHRGSRFSIPDFLFSDVRHGDQTEISKQKREFAN